MTYQAKFLLAIALAAAWPCAAGETRAKRIDPVPQSISWLAREGVVVATPGRRQLVALPDWSWVDEAHACPPALAVGPHGEILVTSNVLPYVWKVDPETRNVTVHKLELDSDRDKDVGFSTLRYSPDDKAWFAFSAALGSTWRIDPGLTQGKKIASNPDRRMTCAIN